MEDITKESLKYSEKKWKENWFDREEAKIYHENLANVRNSEGKNL